MGKLVFHCRRIVGLAAALAALALVASCTVRPLYSDSATLGKGGQSYGMADELASIAIKPATTRYGQEVRNQLIFMFGRGAGEPAAPRYSLDLSVASLRENATYRQAVGTGTDLEPTAATITMIANYRLTNVADGSPVASGRRSVMSSFDVPRQAYAEMRAERDAQNRAARELAELLRAAIAQDLARGG